VGNRCVDVGQVLPFCVKAINKNLLREINELDSHLFSLSHQLAFLQADELDHEEIEAVVGDSSLYLLLP